MGGRCGVWVGGGARAIVCVLVGAAGAAAQGPTYVSDEAREVVEAMVEAHGGLQRWLGAPSFTYTANMYLSSLDVWGETGRTHYDNWRYYRVTVEPRTSRAYVELPLEDAGGPRAGFDGRAVWRLPYDFDPAYRDGPFQLLFFHYGFVALPWLTQMEGSVLEYVGEKTFPGDSRRLLHVRMTFAPRGKTHAGHIDLYVDPGSDRLAGWGGTGSFPLLPGDVLPAEVPAGPGGVVRLVDAWAEVDGIVVPRAYVSVGFQDERYRVFGTHLVIDPTLSEPFREAWARPPEGAEVVHTVGGGG